MTDFSEMFKDCINLTCVPDFDGITTKILIHSSEDSYYCSFKNKVIYNKRISPMKIKYVKVLDNSFKDYGKIKEKCPEYFL